MTTTTQTFSAQLRADSDALFEAFWEHPFLAGLRDGTVPGEAVLHYVGQDHQYLTAFMRCYGLGIALSPDREWIRFFSDQVAFLLDDEVHAHQVMCEVNGVSYADAQAEELYPSARAYINHMMEAGRDTLGVLVAALAPCPWTYIWAARRALDEGLIAADNPYRGWWEFYGTPELDGLLDEFATRLDRLGAAAGPAERDRMASAFKASCQYEIRFWEMAWARETWAIRPVTGR